MLMIEVQTNIIDMLITSKTKSTIRTQIVKHMEDNDNCLLFAWIVSILE